MINKDMTIEEITEKYPQAIGPLKEMGVNCVVSWELAKKMLSQKS